MYSSTSPHALEGRFYTAKDYEGRTLIINKITHEYWFFLGSVIGFFTLIHWLSVIAKYLGTQPGRTTLSAKNGERPRSATNGSSSLGRLSAAISSTFKVLFFRTAFPLGFGAVVSLGEVALICLYLAATVIFLLVNTHGLQSWWFEDRAASMASAQLPLVVALAGKNSVITFLTGISHEKINILHRAAARTCLFMLWMHAISHFVLGVSGKYGFANAWVQAGALGLGAFTLAAILSIRPIRSRAYEFFLITHIVLIAIFLISGYFHAKGAGYGFYIWPALMLWALDRSLRICRLLWNNQIWRGVNTPYTHATVELLSADTVRLSLTRRFHWNAGQHAYVILPSVSNLPTEAHPFSICSIPGALDGSDGPGDRDISFIVRVREGFTQRLKNHIGKNGQGKVAALIDGPYGLPPDLSPFSTCVIVAGGSGISYAFPLLMNLVHLANRGKSNVSRVVFIWSVRDPAHLEWIADDLRKVVAATPASLNIDLRIYLSRKGARYPTGSIAFGDSPPMSPDVEKQFESETPKSVLAFPVETYAGRPDIHELLKDAVDTAEGPVSVDIAGPVGLIQSVRDALRSSDIVSSGGILRGRAPVTLHVERFGM